MAVAVFCALIEPNFRRQPNPRMIVTIDGPAGAGKSSVARRLADELGFAFLDTGAMYRCVTLACLRRSVPLSDQKLVAMTAINIDIALEGDCVYIDSEDVTDEIRSIEVTRSIKEIADNLEVRSAMVDAQRRWIIGRNAVTEGRDQGTVAFPNAECKIFLTATPEERARRRVQQLKDAGRAADFEEILSQQNLRDRDDMQRTTGALRQAPDSEVVWTDGLTEEQVLRRLIEIVRERQDSVLYRSVPNTTSEPTHPT